MKTILIALALLSATVALVPAAEARGFCVGGVDPWCPGVLCTYDSAARVWRCVEDVPIDCLNVWECWVP